MQIGSRSCILAMGLKSRVAALAKRGFGRSSVVTVWPAVKCILVLYIILPATLADSHQSPLVQIGQIEHFSDHPFNLSKVTKPANL
jgi:hypothetical protein